MRKYLSELGYNIWMALKLIKNDNAKPKKYRARNKGELEPIICPKCGNSLFEKLILNPKRINLKWDQRTGTTKLRCAVKSCGEIVD